jgi:hypothetical protein
MTDPYLRLIARSVVGAPSAPTPARRSTAPRMTRAVVLGDNSDGTVRIQIDGGSSVVVAECLGSVACAATDVVEVIVFGTRVLILGIIATWSVGWQTLTLINGWANFGSPWQPAECRIMGNQVVFRGLIANADAAGSLQAICNVPVAPLYSNLWGAYGSLTGYGDGSWRISCEPSGGTATLFMDEVSSTSVGYLSLDQISYYID